MRELPNVSRSAPTQGASADSEPQAADRELFHPPVIANKIASFIGHPSDREHFIGELEELFDEAVNTSGVQYACRQYWHNLIQMGGNQLRRRWVNVSKPIIEKCRRFWIPAPGSMVNIFAGLLFVITFCHAAGVSGIYGRHTGWFDTGSGYTPLDYSTPNTYGFGSAETTHGLGYVDTYGNNLGYVDTYGNNPGYTDYAYNGKSKYYPSYDSTYYPSYDSTYTPGQGWTVDYSEPLLHL